MKAYVFPGQGTQFPGMGMGFLKRMLDEALNQCKKRIVGGKNLLSLWGNH